MSEESKALRLADYLMHGNPTTTRRDAAEELRRLHHNNEVLMNALWKSCGDNEETVNATIESQGELK